MVVAFIIVNHKIIIMKNQTQPQHTQGEWKNDSVSFAKRHYKDFVVDSEQELIAECYGETKEQAKANAQRIVTAVNEYEALKKKADMHDELVESVKVQLDIIKNLIASKRVVNLDEAISYYEQLLKRSEQK